MKRSPSGWVFDRCAGHVALDFANTVSNRGTPEAIDRLPTYEELLAFARQCELVTPAEARRLEAQARRSPAEAAEVLEEAVGLRDALYHLFTAAAEEGPPPDEALATFNQAVARLHIDGDWRWAWSCCADRLDVMLGPIAMSAAQLLTSPQRGRIRMCAADTCVWVFLDTSKNRSRRWCDMKQCGNRSKARRFYDRHA